MFIDVVAASGVKLSKGRPLDVAFSTGFKGLGRALAIFGLV